jgi:hypothetical protein
MSSSSAAAETPSDVERLVFDSLPSENSTVTLSELKETHSTIPSKLFLDAVNELLRTERVKLLRLSDDVTAIARLAPAERRRFTGLSNDHRLVYQVVAAAGRDGVWKKHLRMKTVTQNFQSILDRLVLRTLIRPVQQKGTNKRFFILHELEPSPQLVGGVFYTRAGELDEVLVRSLLVTTRHFIKEATAIHDAFVRRIFFFFFFFFVVVVVCRCHLSPSCSSSAVLPPCCPASCSCNRAHQIYSCFMYQSLFGYHNLIQFDFVPTRFICNGEH